MIAGKHIIADFSGVKIPENKRKLSRLLKEATRKAGGTPLKFSGYQFTPYGITAVLILAESHISIHSWPEYEYAAIDVFTCGIKTDPLKAVEYLRRALNPKGVVIKKIKRSYNTRIWTTKTRKK
jgi:S-adenosylmethionine decarboxylase proenzyme